MSSKKPAPKAGPSEADKARFREALDKKRSHAGRDVADHGERGKVDHAHGAETNAREQMFRRKSG
jgi:hypothetical protein